MTFAPAIFRRRMLQGAPLMALAASVLPRGGTLACLAAWTIISVSRAKANYPYPQRRGATHRVFFAWLCGAMVYLALTATFGTRVIPPPLFKSGAAVFAVCAVAGGARIAKKRARILGGALLLLACCLYAL